MISVLELRRYTLKPGARERLVELFDREFVESQEALGMRILGTFRDLDDPDQFVWLRGFADLASRAPALEAFYTGPVWQRPQCRGERDDGGRRQRLALAARRGRPGLRATTRRGVRPVGAPERDAAAHGGDRSRRGRLEVIESALGESVLARFVTEHARNDFPALPVREDVDVVVALAAGEHELPAGVETTTASADPAFAASLRRAALAVSGRAGQPAEQVDERLELVGREALLEDLDDLPDVGAARPTRAARGPRRSALRR